MRSLKRQASAARRYRENEAEYGHLLGRRARCVAGTRCRRVSSDVRQRLGELRAADAELAAALHRAEATLAAGREESETLAEDVARRHSRRAELLATIEGRQEFVKASRQALRDTADGLARGRQLAERLDEELGRIAREPVDAGRAARTSCAPRSTRPSSRWRRTTTR